MRGVFLQTYKENTANQKEIHYSHVDNILCNQTTIMIQKQKFYRKYWICLPYTLDQLVQLDSTYGCTDHIDHLAQLYQYTLVQGMLLLQVCPPKIFDKYHNKAAKQKKILYSGYLIHMKLNRQVYHNTSCTCCMVFSVSQLFFINLWKIAWHISVC